MNQIKEIRMKIRAMEDFKEKAPEDMQTYVNSRLNLLTEQLDKEILKQLSRDSDETKTP